MYAILAFDACKIATWCSNINIQLAETGKHPNQQVLYTLNSIPRCVHYRSLAQREATKFWHFN
jgi:hypothetical protein